MTRTTMPWPIAGTLPCHMLSSAGQPAVEGGAIFPLSCVLHGVQLALKAVI